jgi:myb proto-oncogene protein
MNTKTRKNPKVKWTKKEDTALTNAVKELDGKNWKKIAERIPNRTDMQCQHRWQKVLNPSLHKGPWTKEEDQKVIQLVKKHGPKNWSLIAMQLKGRIGKQCRERWHNHLNPNVNKSSWTQEEDGIIYQYQKKMGKSMGKNC